MENLILEDSRIDRFILFLFLILIFNLAFWPLPVCHAQSTHNNHSASSIVKKTLSPSDRSSLRYHLENLFNEMDLLIKNQRVDLADLKRQEKELSIFKVYERIPFKQDIEGLKLQLTNSLKASGLKLVNLKVTGFSPPGKPIPKQVYTNTMQFHLAQDQLVEKIYFKMNIKGSPEKIKYWMETSLPDLLRIIEVDPPRTPQLVNKAIQPAWQIRAHAFRFRDIQFPKLVPISPREYLPQWAQVNPKVFSENEPFLWSFVTRIEELAPRTPPFYANRSRFLLNDARYSFFLSKEPGFQFRKD